MEIVPARPGLPLGPSFLASAAAPLIAGLGASCLAQPPAVDAWLERSERAFHTRSGSPLSAATEALSANSQPAETVQRAQQWTTLFDGKSLVDWKAGVYGDSPELDFTAEGVVIPQGVPLSGVTYLREPPRGAYTLEVQATRVYGTDFFLGLTFPVQDEHVTLVLGGWGGGLCGLSCIDGKDASMNATRTFRNFPNGKRQTVIIEVSAERIRAFTNGEILVDTSIAGKRLSLRNEVTPSRPLGVAAFATQTILHSVRLALPSE